MSNDQASAVDGEAAFLDALGPEPVEEEEQDQAEGETPEGEEPEADPEAEETPPDLFKITVKNDEGKDEEKEVSLDELAKGYMLQSDYTRKTKAVADEKRQVEAKFSKDLASSQQSAMERIAQLQELVMKQAAPELASVDWVTLASNDPAEFVRLKARQEQLGGIIQSLEGDKVKFHQQREQHIAEQVDQALKQSDEILTKAIEGFDGTKAGKLLETVDKFLGWKPKDIQLATRLIVEAGMKPETMGQILVLAHKAQQFDELSAKKPAALKKVAAAPKVIRPSAPQPKKPNQAALDRLRKSGRGEDFMKFL